MALLRHSLLSQPLLILHEDAELRARVLRAIPPGMHALEARDWGALRLLVLRAAPGALAVVDPYHGRGTGQPAAALARLLHEFPKLPVLAAARFEEGQTAHALMLGAWGVADVLDLGAQDSRAALRRNLQAHRTAYFARVLAPFPAPASNAARSLLVEALEVAAGWGGAEQWAALRGISGRTLLRRCSLAGLPPPRRLLAWARLLLVADLLESPGHTVATTALACGYAGDMPLRRAVQKLTGAEVQELRGAGALVAVAARFVAELEVWRHQGEGR